jgi:RNA polymerase sigma factor (sigma-70 family)
MPITDQTIVTGLKNRDVIIINYLYRQFFQQIRSFVESNSGTLMDAEDAFQDALVVIYKKISSKDFSLTCAFNTYLYSVCRYLWLQRLNKRKSGEEFKQSVSQDYPWSDTNETDELIGEIDKFNLFQQHFVKLRKEDQQVLKLYMNKVSLKEIAGILGFKSEKYAKTRKYICKEKLKTSIMNDPRYRELCADSLPQPVLQG